MSRGFCFQIYGARLRIGTGWEKKHWMEGVANITPAIFTSRDISC